MMKEGARRNGVAVGPNIKEGLLCTISSGLDQIFSGIGCVGGADPARRACWGGRMGGGYGSPARTAGVHGKTIRERVERHHAEAERLWKSGW